YDKLNLHAGLSDEEIEDSIQHRKEILEWMVDQRIDTVNSVGKVVAEFYSDQDRVINLAKNDADPGELLDEEEGAWTKEDNG
ncbi:MAG: hypothetical protein SVU32_07805, partial [Candidatus Nanohaloarchaea archaeon]|nr:hypothetical protein [Candidatus Nanohaloarchaea archaeon]